MYKIYNRTIISMILEKVVILLIVQGVFLYSEPIILLIARLYTHFWLFCQLMLCRDLFIHNPGSAQQIKVKPVKN